MSIKEYIDYINNTWPSDEALEEIHNVESIYSMNKMFRLDITLNDDISLLFSDEHLNETVYKDTNLG